MEEPNLNSVSHVSSSQSQNLRKRVRKTRQQPDDHLSNISVIECSQELKPKKRRKSKRKKTTKEQDVSASVFVDPNLLIKYKRYDEKCEERELKLSQTIQKVFEGTEIKAQEKSNDAEKTFCSEIETNKQVNAKEPQKINVTNTETVNMDLTDLRITTQPLVHVEAEKPTNSIEKRHSIESLQESILPPIEIEPDIKNGMKDLSIKEVENMDLQEEVLHPTETEVQQLLNAPVDDIEEMKLCLSSGTSSIIFPAQIQMNERSYDSLPVDSDFQPAPITTCLSKPTEPLKFIMTDENVVDLAIKLKIDPFRLYEEMYMMVQHPGIFSNEDLRIPTRGDSSHMNRNPYFQNYAHFMSKKDK